MNFLLSIKNKLCQESKKKMCSVFICACRFILDNLFIRLTTALEQKKIQPTAWLIYLPEVQVGTKGKVENPSWQV